MGSDGFNLCHFTIQLPVPFRITQIQGTTLPKPPLNILLSSHGHSSKGQTAESSESSVRIRELGNLRKPKEAKSINFVN